MNLHSCKMMPRAPASDPETRRRAILIAAHRCFARSGFRDTTMQDIADEAGLSVGALYRYFPGKDALIEALASWGRTQKSRLLGRLDATDGGGDGSDSPGAVLEDVLRILEGEGALAATHLDVRLWGEALGNPALATLVRGGLEGLRRPLVDHLSELDDLRARGEPVDPETAGRVLIAVLVGLELQKAFDPELDIAACGRLLRLWTETLTEE